VYQYVKRKHGEVGDINGLKLLRHWGKKTSA